MATVEDFIYDRLASDSAIAAVVGTRIHRVRMPDNPTLPAITYQTNYGEVTESWEGFAGLSQPIIGIDCWAESAGAAQALAAGVMAALLGYEGVYEDRVIFNILDWSQSDLYDADTGIFHVSCSCRVWYQ